MAKNKKDTSNKSSNQNIEQATLVLFIVLISIHIVGAFWHSYYSWGFSYLSVLPKSLSLTFGVIVLAVVCLLYFKRISLNKNCSPQQYLDDNSRLNSILWSTVCSVILLSLFYFFRSKAHIYGDGFTVLELSSTEESLEIIGQHKLQLLAVYFHNSIYNLLSSFSFLNAEKIFALTNIVGGLIGYWAIYKISEILSRSKIEQIFYVIISFSSVSVILFFGYIENYTWAMSFSLWSIYYMIKYINEKCSVVPLITFTVIAFAFHMVTLPVVVTALFVVLSRAKSTTNILSRLSYTYLLLIALAGSFLIAIISQLEGLTVFVPLWEIPGNNYSFFSVNHFSDIFNMLLLLAPLGLLFLLLSFTQKKPYEQKNDKTEQVLFVVSLLTFLSACFIDPQLGAVRDWDLFAFYGIPLTLFAGYKFTLYFDIEKFPVWVITASLVFTFIHIGPNLYEKNNSEIAVEYLDVILWDDPHYQAEYQEAYRGQSWGYILRKNVNRNDLAEKYFTRRIELDKFDSNPLYNLGVLHFEKGQLDSARYYLHKGFQLTPNQPKFMSKLSEVEARAQNIPLAEMFARGSLKLDSTHIPGLTALAIALIEKKQTNNALVYFKKAYRLSPDDYEQVINLGILYSKGINIDSAYFYLDKALPLAPDNQKPNILSSLISIRLAMNQKTDAIEYFNQLKSIAPNSPMLKEIENKINQN